MKFKKGDKVNAISETFGWGRVDPRAVGTVTHAGSRVVIVDFPKQSGWNALEKDLRFHHGWIVEEDEVKKKKKPYKPLQSKVKKHKIKL